MQNKNSKVRCKSGISSLNVGLRLTCNYAYSPLKYILIFQNIPKYIPISVAL